MTRPAHRPDCHCPPPVNRCDYRDPSRTGMIAAPIILVLVWLALAAATRAL